MQWLRGCLPTSAPPSGPAALPAARARPCTSEARSHWHMQCRTTTSGKQTQPERTPRRPRRNCDLLKRPGHSMAKTCGTPDYCSPARMRRGHAMQSSPSPVPRLLGHEADERVDVLTLWGSRPQDPAPDCDTIRVAPLVHGPYGQLPQLEQAGGLVLRSLDVSGDAVGRLMKGMGLRRRAGRTLSRGAPTSRNMA